MFFVIPFGLVFASAGTTLVIVSLLNIPTLFRGESDLLKNCFGLLVPLAMGGAHATVGFALMWVAIATPEWLNIDLHEGVLKKQTGVLLFRKIATARLGEFTEVSIFPIARTLFRQEGFDVALTGPNDKRFTLGRVTLSYDLAREFGHEVASFLGLPLH